MSEQRTFTMAEGLAAVLRRWKTVVRVGCVVGLLAGIITFLRPVGYASSATVTPADPGNDVSRLAGLAAQFGVNLPGGSATQSSDYYAEILRSPDVLGPVVDEIYSVPSGDSTALMPLSQYLEPEADTKAIAHDQAMKDLLKIVNINSQPQLNLLRFTVTTDTPELAHQVAMELLDQLQHLNVRSRQIQASAGRTFLQGRVAITTGALRAAEDSLLAFLQKNRNYSNSPALTFEHDRIQRSVQMQQDLYTSLMQSFDQASMDAVRSTPELVAVETPARPAQHVPRGTVLMTLAFGILGGLGAIAWVVTADRYRSVRLEEPEVYGLLESAWDKFRTEMRVPDRFRVWRRWSRQKDTT